MYIIIQLYDLSILFYRPMLSGPGVCHKKSHPGSYGFVVIETVVGTL